MLRSTPTYVTASLALTIALSSACSHQGPAECNELCTLPEEQQYQRFKSHPVEKQFELYEHCENEETCLHDSASSHDQFGQWMAQDDRAVAFLVERLKTERDEDAQWDILYVLRFMAEAGHLKGRHDVAEVANQVTGRMGNGFIARIFGDKWRVERSKEWARQIEQNTR
jgi:hypothetical protein